MEFLGAILAGSRVAGTIKNGIISLSVFDNNPGVELLAFACALVASATWLTIATHNAWPVSTTYSIVSALAGVGVALGGADAVQWGWNDGKGLGTIFAGFGIAPGIAAGFGAVLFLITKYAVLKRQNTVRAALIASPIYFFGVTAILTLTIGESDTLKRVYYKLTLVPRSVQGSAESPSRQAVRCYASPCHCSHFPGRCTPLAAVLAALRVRQGHPQGLQ